MKKNLKRIVLIILSLIIIIGITIYILNINKDKKQNDKLIKEIKQDYKTLETNISNYNNIRENITNILENTYTEELDKQYDQIINSLNQEENQVSIIQEKIKNLETNCETKTIKPTDINNICNNYKEYYEKIANIYLNDIKEVNKIINTYNQDKKENLEPFTTKTITDYIDYNKDGIYLEREENDA